MAYCRDTTCSVQQVYRLFSIALSMYLANRDENAGNSLRNSTRQVSQIDHIKQKLLREKKKKKVSGSYKSNNHRDDRWSRTSNLGEEQISFIWIPTWEQVCSIPSWIISYTATRIPLFGNLIEKNINKISKASSIRFWWDKYKLHRTEEHHA